MTAKALDGGNLIKRSLARLRAGMRTGDEAAVEKELTGLETITDLEGASDPAIGAANPGSTININLGDKDKEDEEDDKTKDATRDARDKAIDKFMSDTNENFKKINDSIEELKKGGEKKDKVEDEKILGALQMEAPPGTSDALTMDSTKDSTVLAHSYQETVSMAEVLAPGITPPTFDVKLPAAKTFDSICKHRRSALSIAVNNPKLVGFIRSGLPQGKTFDSMSCDETRTLFKASAAVAAAINNGAGKTADVNINGGGAKTNSKVTSIKDLQELAKKTYKTQN